MMLHTTKRLSSTYSRRALDWHLVAGLVVLMVVLSCPARVHADDDDDDDSANNQVSFTFSYIDGTYGYYPGVDANPNTSQNPKQAIEYMGWGEAVDQSVNYYPLPLPATPPDSNFYTWVRFSLTYTKLKKGQIISFGLPSEEHAWYDSPGGPGLITEAGSAYEDPFGGVAYLDARGNSSCACTNPLFINITPGVNSEPYDTSYGDGFNLFELVYSQRVGSATYRYLGSASDLNTPNADPGGTGSAGNGSAHLKFSLGNNANGATAGDIQFNQDAFSVGSYSPAALQAGGYAGVTILNAYDTSGNVCVRQALSGDVLADVITDSATQYHISFYPASQVSGTDPNTGLYLTGGQAPFVTYTVANPDTSGATTTQLQLTESRPGQADKVSLFTLTSFNNGTIYTTSSTLLTDNGTRQDIRTSTNTGYLADFSLDHVIQTLVGSNWVTVLHERSINHYYSFGYFTSQKIVDPDGANLITSYSYYDSPDPSEAYHQGQIKSVTYPDGSWETDDWLNGTQVQTLTPWKDSAGVTAATATSANCHATIINGSETDELINGTLVSKTVGNSSTNTVEGQAVTIDAETSYASAADSTGLTTTTYTYASYLTGPSASKLYGIDNPDGTGERHYYTQGDYDGTALAFTPDVNGTAVSEEIVHNGGPAQGTCDVHVTNAAGQLVLEETYLGGYSVNPAANPANRISQTAHAFDANGNPTLDTLNGRVTHQQSWANGQRQSEIDESGIETDYTYDLRNRLASSTKKGVPAYGAYAAQGGHRDHL